MSNVKVKKTKTGFEFTKTDKEPSNPKGWKDRYDIACPYCLHKMQCAPYIWHYMGMQDGGRGDCSKCKHKFEIHFMPATNTMTTHKLEKELMQ